MWALDIGTTNTRLARWDAGRDRPQLVHLSEISWQSAQSDVLEVPRLVPSATRVLEKPSALARLSASGPFAGRVFWGRLAHIGREALEHHAQSGTSGFSATFKSALGQSPLRTLTSLSGRAYSAREIAWLFLRELLAATRAETGERIRELTLTVPVDSYESYRAELSAAFLRLGVTQLRFLDEPVAAAIGYSLSERAARHVLVVDFGGGTLDLAFVRLDAGALRTGSCRVLAKAGRALGGNLVDGWLLEHFCQRLGYRLTEADDTGGGFWRRLMLDEARRVKEAVLLEPSATFELYPPEDLRRFEARLVGESRELSVSRQEVVELLTERGLYRALDECRREVLSQTALDAGPRQEVDDVLLVGGSTLLPGVFSLFEREFGRDRVRSWQPFEAVAYGAAAFAAGRVHSSDFLLHDYALLTHAPGTGEPEYTVIVPRGTRVPTVMDLWKRQLVPTCALGEPERFFKLVICEIGESAEERSFGWDDAGHLHKLGGRADGTKQRLVVKLNQADPALGDLEPPHSPSDRRPRLQIAFGVNAERWLCATVLDLRTNRFLMQEEPVVRVL